MKQFLNKIDSLKPARGYYNLAHQLLMVVMPFLIILLLKISYLGLILSFGLVILSKWRMFAIKPRFWLAMFRANAVDIIVGVSVVCLMSQASSLVVQLLLAVFYVVWLLAIKPGTQIVQVSVQALIGQLAGFMALFVIWPSGPLYGLVIVSALIAYLSARHFFDAFKEPYSRMLAYLWAYFVAGLVWVLAHWLLFYGQVVALPTIIVTVVGYGLAVLYYYDHYDKLKPMLKQQILAIMAVVLLIIIIFSDWGDKVV